MELSSSGGEGVSVARGSGQRTGRGSAGGGGAASTGNAVFSVSRLAPQSPRWPLSSASSRRFPEKALLPWEHTSNYSACRKSLSANLAGTRRFYRANTASWLDL